MWTSANSTASNRSCRPSANSSPQAFTRRSRGRSTADRSCASTGLALACAPAAAASAAPSPPRGNGLNAAGPATAAASGACRVDSGTSFRSSMKSHHIALIDTYATNCTGAHNICLMTRTCAMNDGQQRARISHRHAISTIQIIFSFSRLNMLDLRVFDACDRMVEWEYCNVSLRPSKTKRTQSTALIQDSPLVSYARRRHPTR